MNRIVRRFAPRSFVPVAALAALVAAAALLSSVSPARAGGRLDASIEREAREHPQARVVAWI